jgi:branched-chain amino acid transport system ATP-binding protein
MLTIDNLHAYYGKSHVLHGVGFEVGQGEIVALLGRNGSGRSTTAKAIMGLVECQGRIDWKGQPIQGKKAYEIAHLGLGYVPEGRQIFPELTVMENLAVGQRQPSRLWPEARLFALLPNLRDRRANAGRALSGGEQQMLAIARALVTDPRVLLLDEPSQGLAPMVVQELARVLRQLADEGVAVLLVEQNLRLTEAVADRILIMARGRIVHDDTAPAFRAAEDELRHRWLSM